MITELELTFPQRELLQEGLEKHELCYDPQEHMLLLPVPANASYHTRLRNGLVHPVFRSLVYAVALLDAGTEPYRLRAIDILRRVVALQDIRPESRTYGIWSWYLEEPLEQMAPPDWNFADFCGTQLLEAVLVHEARLPADLLASMDTAILHAARSIQRRNVGPDYTNIAIMGSFVTLAAAERFDLADLLAYATDKFRGFYEHTLRHGAFNEYNSPAYTSIALNELGRIRCYVRDTHSQHYADELYRHAWELMASHFHPPTQQWAGPHCRSYSTFLRGATAHFFARAMPGRFHPVIPLGDVQLDEQRHVHACPAEMVDLFLKLDEPRSVRQVFRKGGCDLVGTTYLHPLFSLGSINRGDLWNQRRPLLAYWGSAQSPRYFVPRFLHDDYDFSAAHICVQQQQGDALAGISFAYDAGDTHINLDMIKDGTIRARDLRLRLEFGGLPEHIAPVLEVEADGTARCSVTCDGVCVDVLMPIALWDGKAGHWVENRADGVLSLDYVFYSGSEKVFVMQQMGPTHLALAVQIRPVSEAKPAGVVTHTETDGITTLKWKSFDLRLPVYPHRSECLL